MDIVLQILYTVLVLGFLIFIHEFGHFITAKLSKIKVNEFAIGMGPTIFKIQGKETKYAIRLFPIGGFVSMEGEDEESDDENSFTSKPVWKRIIVVVAGATMNLILGFIITAIIVVRSAALPSTTIAEFTEDAVSYQYGLQVDDQILKVGNKPVFVYADIASAFSMALDTETVDITVKRDGEKITLYGVKFPQLQLSEELSGLDTDFKVYKEEKNFVNIVKQSFFRTGSYVTMMYDTLRELFTGGLSVKYVSGPVGTSTVISQAAKLGIDTFLSLVALLSINLAVVNLLPLPALDGGRFIFLLIELVRGKPVPQKYESVVHLVGMVILLLFSVFIMLKDIFFPVV